MTSRGPSRRVPLEAVLRGCDGIRTVLATRGERLPSGVPAEGFARARALVSRYGSAPYAAVQLRSDKRVVRVVSEFDSKEDAVRFADEKGWADFTVVPCQGPMA